ncbi:hypothetical protein Trydic_g4250 [Trypoxylus dichotomus]
MLRSTRPAKKNLNTKELKALIGLKRNVNIIILQADKGCARSEQHKITGLSSCAIPYKPTKPYGEQMTFSVKNADHFIDVLPQQHVESTDILISFDVTWLFTQVPVNETVDIIRNKHQVEHYLINLLDYDLKDTYFTCNHQRYVDDTLGHTVYRKTTHTNFYLNVDSHHHPAQLQQMPKILVSKSQRLAVADHIRTESSEIKHTANQRCHH